MRDHRLTGDADRGGNHDRNADHDDRVVGRTTLVETAMRGVAGEAVALPYADVIQRSFGRHDIRGVRAHIGGSSAEAAHALGANAYAVGDSIAFAAAPDLHLAAHEAAHVIQQRRGVRLFGGIGTAGDEYERHADAVADRVVQGMSAEPLLDEIGGAGPTHMAVQRDERRSLIERAQGVVHTTISSLCDIGRYVPQMAIGTSYTLEVGVQIPIPVRVCNLLIGGKLTLECSRSQQGYEVSIMPRLTAGASDTRGEYSGVVAIEASIGARGATRDAIGRLVEMALDHAVRACGRPVPPFLPAIFMRSSVGEVIELADEASRLLNYWRTGRLTSQFWPWLADVLFDRARIAATRNGMHDGEYSEMRDRVGVEGRHRGSGLAGGAAYERRWRVDDDHEFENDAIEGTVSINDNNASASMNVLASGSAKFRYLRPAADPRVFPGEAQIDINFGTKNVALTILSAIAIRRIFEKVLAAAGRRSSSLDTDLEACWAAIAATGHGYVASRTTNDSAQFGISITWPFDGADISVTFKTTTTFDAMTEGNGCVLAQGLTLGTATLPGVPHAHATRGTPRDGLGRQAASTDGRMRNPNRH